jgi:hypothetical protein
MCLTRTYHVSTVHGGCMFAPYMSQPQRAAKVIFVQALIVILACQPGLRQARTCAALRAQTCWPRARLLHDPRMHRSVCPATIAHAPATASRHCTYTRTPRTMHAYRHIEDICIRHSAEDMQHTQTRTMQAPLSGKAAAETETRAKTTPPRADTRRTACIAQAPPARSCHRPWLCPALAHLRAAATSAAAAAMSRAGLLQGACPARRRSVRGVAPCAARPHNARARPGTRSALAAASACTRGRAAGKTRPCSGAGWVHGAVNAFVLLIIAFCLHHGSSVVGFVSGHLPCSQSCSNSQPLHVPAPFSYCVLYI